MEMDRIVTKIEEFDKKRYKIYIDGEFAFVLYKGEISHYQISQDKVIREEVYCRIMDEVLVKRAKKRCLNLLQKKNYTEYKLREKLKEGYYPIEVEDIAIEYVKSYGYIDDYRYAEEYVFYHKTTESRKKIEEKLKRKGISSNIIEQVFSESYEEGEAEETELQQVIKLLQKKHYDEETMDWKEKQKIYLFLLRKGIRSSVVKKAMMLQDIV